MRAKLLGTFALGLCLGGLVIWPFSVVAAASHGPSVEQALTTLERSGAITQSALSTYRSDFEAAESSDERLSGTRRSELGAVLENVQAMAVGGDFTPSRLPVIFLTLVENRYWWTTGPLLSTDERISLPNSKIVWEYYPGQGIEIQWLGTFGKANGYYLAGNENGDLRELLDEVIPLATRRAGGIAWEYMFHFDGGAPPWTSGLSQGTALQALARAWSRLKEPSYLTAAEEALGIFQKAPPEGVRVARTGGIWYAEYSYAPTDRILNGFIQALIGLYDFTYYTKSPLGLALFESGDSLARVEVPHFNTGSWSMYDQHTESDLNYHDLLTEFLQNLCTLTSSGPPIAPLTTASTGTTTAASTTTGATTTGTPTTGAATTGTATTGTTTTGTATTGTTTTGGGEAGGTAAQVAEALTGGAEASTPTRTAASTRTAGATTETPATGATTTGATTTGTTTGAATTGATTTGGGENGGTAVQESETQTGGASTSSTAIPGDSVYCTTASSFTSDLHTPPKVVLLSHTLPGGARAGVQLSLSKIATVSLSVRQGSRVVWSNEALVESGDPRLLWVTPSSGGTYEVTVSARDLAGNAAQTTGTIKVTRAR